MERIEEFYDVFNLAEEAGTTLLSEQEKQELREMAAAESLREEFGAMRRNSELVERMLTVDKLAHWLTAMTGLCPAPPNPRPPAHYTKVKL